MFREDETKVTYWTVINGEEDNILTVKTTVVPKVGEEIHINTHMDKEWYDTNFPNSKLYRQGVRGNFIVTKVKRYYTNHDYVSEQIIGESTYKLPAQQTIEEFEVFIDQID